MAIKVLYAERESASAPVLASIEAVMESLTSVNLPISLANIAGLTSFSANLIRATMVLPHLVFLIDFSNFLKVWFNLVV